MVKLVRFDAGGGPTPGLIVGDEVIDLSRPDDGFGSIVEIAAGGPRALERLRLLAPIERPGKFLAIGMNYKKHLAEAQRLGCPPRRSSCGSTNKPHASRVPTTRSSPA